MADPSILDELTKAVPVVIGGLLALSGGLVGHIVTHRLAKSRERESMTRQKAEALVKALYAHMQWLEEKRITLIFRGGEHDTPAPLDEARMIQRLYFPELASEMVAVSQAYVPMLKFILEQQIERMKDKEAWIKSWNVEEYGKHYTACQVAVQAAAEKMVRVLDERFKS
jgi:hypothetical protein